MFLVFLQFVILVFPDHTHLLFLGKSHVLYYKVSKMTDSTLKVSDLTYNSMRFQKDVRKQFAFCSLANYLIFLNKIIKLGILIL